MDARGQELLELDEVRERLAGVCASPQGAERARQVDPSGDVAEVARRQALTAQGIGLAELGVQMPAGIEDVRPDVGLAARGVTLDVAALGAVSGTLRAVDEVVASLTSHSECAPTLAESASLVDRDLVNAIAEAIERALDGHGGLRDEASLDLAQARRALAGARTAASEVLRSAAQRAREHLQEGFITERGGRPVLAVKASARSAVPGIVHDRSATGQTVFIEPFDVVEANNRVREAEATERIEVERVLATLSGTVRDGADAIGFALEVVGDVDLVLARAEISRRWRGCSVTVDDSVVLRRARHPLLDPGVVVPIDLPLAGVAVLVVSGPNAGGKTVALKTLGLLAMIHQCGIRPPADEARLPVFSDILVDIGDDQSIERNLSTFSGHLRRLVDILDRAGPRSLVLLDEVAAGTDPAEGAAIGRAVLEALKDKGALTLVTTHHHELKGWASETPDVANAAVGFDAAALAPTFTIRVGEPGASHALEVAERLGLPGDILESARRIVGDERSGVEALLQDAAAARVAAEDERDRALAERDEAARVRAEVEQREHELSQRLERMRADAATARTRARQEAQAELGGLQAEMTAFRAELAAARREERRRATERSAGDTAERDRRLGAAAAAAQRATAQLGDLTRPSRRDEALAVGDRVIVADLGVRGEVVSLQGSTAEVQGPSARLRIDVARLVRDGRVDANPSPAPREVRPVMAPVPYELDVRGQRAEAVVSAVRGHVDAAAIAGLEEVRIVHGRGTGALREVVKKTLTAHPLVASSTLAGPDAGGDGATIATLK